MRDSSDRKERWDMTSDCEQQIHGLINKGDIIDLQTVKLNQFTWFPDGTSFLKMWPSNSGGDFVKVPSIEIDEIKPHRDCMWRAYASEVLKVWEWWNIGRRYWTPNLGCIEQ